MSATRQWRLIRADLDELRAQYDEFQQHHDNDDPNSYPNCCGRLDSVDCWNYYLRYASDPQMQPRLVPMHDVLEIMDRSRHEDED